MEYLQNTFFGSTPRKVSHSLKDSGACLCDWCSTRLRKHDGYLNVYAYQFTGPLDDLSNEQKDEAISNHGIVSGLNYDASYGQAFHGKILPHSRPFGKFNHPMSDSCNGSECARSYVNPYQQSTQVCELGGCISGDCREYGDALERYLECREKCPKQDIASVTKMCGPPPINPAVNSCKRNWTSNYKTQNTLGGWMPDIAYRK